MSPTTTTNLNIYLFGAEQLHEVGGDAGHHVPVHMEVGAFNLHQVKEPMCENGSPHTHAK